MRNANDYEGLRIYLEVRGTAASKLLDAPLCFPQRWNVGPGGRRAGSL